MCRTFAHSKHFIKLSRLERVLGIVDQETVERSESHVSGRGAGPGRVGARSTGGLGSGWTGILRLGWTGSIVERDLIKVDALLISLYSFKFFTSFRDFVLCWVILCSICALSTLS